MRKLLALSMVVLLALVIAIASGCPPPSHSAEVILTPAVPLQINDPIRVWLKGDNGAVMLRVRVNRDGRVDRILANSASDQLKPLYERVAKDWRFQPALRDGQPTESVVTLRLEYTIKSSYVVVDGR